MTGYIVFGLLSVLTLLVLIIMTSIKSKKEKKHNKRIVSNLQKITGYFFIAAVIMFIPVHYVNYPENFGDGFAYVRPFLISVHSALRLFVLDGEFDAIVNATEFFKDSALIHAAFNFYAAVLYVVAPFLTFINVISLFKSVWNRFKFFVIRMTGRYDVIYIFSELNERSVTMAESIFKRSTKEHTDGNKTESKPPVIVFTDVFEKEREEKDYDLLMRAYDLKAVLLKTDITRLESEHRPKSKKTNNRRQGRIEFFIIGDDEAENIEQLIRLNDIYKNFDGRSISIYLFSATEAAGYILDSIKKGPNTVSEKIKSRLYSAENNGDPDTMSPLDRFLKEETEDADYSISEGFYVRRINPVDDLALQTLSDTELARHLIKNCGANKRISLLVVGCGLQGMSFIKNALWLYQINGYLTEITVVDKLSDGEIKDFIHNQCPDIVIGKDKKKPADAAYRINVIGNTDIFRSDVYTVLGQKHKDIMRNVQAVFVVLGDDDKNIGAAVKMRKIFDRIKISDNKQPDAKDEYETPFIYAVVFDDKKSKNLHLSHSGNESGLINYKGEQYNIGFIGSLKQQYSYNVIERQKEIEEKAFRCHFEWIRNACKLRETYYSDPDQDDSLSDEDKAAIKEYKKRIKDYYVDSKKSGDAEKDKEIRITWNDEDLYADTKTPVYRKAKPEKVKKLIMDYADFEYPRNSSAAKALQKEMLGRVFEEKKHNKVCCCKYCLESRKTEHMRWNMYMRTAGYSYNKKRSDRAQFHNDIIAWDQLPPLEQYKD